MAEFPPNLDDGERWLPSDIFPDEFPDEVPSRYCPHFPGIDQLAQHLATFTSLQPYQSTPPKPPPNLQRFLPPVRCAPVGSPPTSHSRALDVGHSLSSYGTRGFCACPTPFYHDHLLQPVHPQVKKPAEGEGFLQMRARVSQGQHNNFQKPVLPGQGSGVGGTGVFLPRVATINTTTTTTATDVRKKQGPPNKVDDKMGLQPRESPYMSKSLTNRQEVQIRQQRHSINRAAVVKQEECHCQLTPEMGLPQDWTY